MEKQQQSSVVVLLFMMLVLLSSANSLSFISDEALQTRLPARRVLLQIQRDCPVDFGKLDYTILTNKCKGPEYPKEPCCSAFKELACPYAYFLNDRTTNCAESMFDNIHRFFPPGIFADKCPDDERGITCMPSRSLSPSFSYYPFLNRD